MVGYIVIALTVLLFLFFVIKHSRRFLKQLKLTKIGYCLVVRKYEENGAYFLVFQQGEREWICACPYKIYSKTALLTRETLILHEEAFHSFER